MGSKKSKADYRQIYKDYYGIDFDSSFAVHHIDFDRQNNAIDNLLLMPRQLHAKYHFVYSQLFGPDKTADLSREFRLTDAAVSFHYSQWLRLMAETLDEVIPWFKMKQFGYDELQANLGLVKQDGKCGMDKNSNSHI